MPHPIDSNLISANGQVPQSVPEEGATYDTWHKWAWDHTYAIRADDAEPCAICMHDGRPAFTVLTRDSVLLHAEAEYGPDEIARLQEEVDERDRLKHENDLIDRIARECENIEVRETAREWYKIKKRADQIGEFPAPVTLDALIAEADLEAQYRVAGLWPVEGRVILAATKKSGKTTMVGNLVKAFADNELFLDTLPVQPLKGRVVVLDFEMSRRMLGRWYRDQGIQNRDAVRVTPLRGAGSAFDITSDDTRSDWAARLKEIDTEVLILDCLAPALSTLGLNETNEDVSTYLGAVDALLREADVPECLVVHHMGHSGERSRGASRLRDWPEVEWKLVRERDGDEEKDSGPRFFSAYGRDVDMSESMLTYDTETRHLSLIPGAGDRRQRRNTEMRDAVIEIVTANPGINTGVLKQAISDRTKVNRAEDLVAAVDSAILHGDIFCEKKGTSKLHYINSGGPVEL